MYGCNLGRELIDEEFDELFEALFDELFDELFEELFEEALDDIGRLDEALLDDGRVDGRCEELPHDPPAAISSSSSVNSMAPAGFSGNSAKSSSLRLVRYTGSFHARMILSRIIHFPPLLANQLEVETWEYSGTSHPCVSYCEWTRFAYALPRASSCLCVPCSTMTPSSSTRILSASRTVLSR